MGVFVKKKTKIFAGLTVGMMSLNLGIDHGTSDITSDTIKSPTVLPNSNQNEEQELKQQDINCVTNISVLHQPRQSLQSFGCQYLHTESVKIGSKMIKMNGQGSRKMKKMNNTHYGKRTPKQNKQQQRKKIEVGKSVKGKRKTNKEQSTSRRKLTGGLSSILLLTTLLTQNQEQMLPNHGYSKGINNTIPNYEYRNNSNGFNQFNRFNRSHRQDASSVYRPTGQNGSYKTGQNGSLAVGNLDGFQYTNSTNSYQGSVLNPTLLTSGLNIEKGNWSNWSTQDTQDTQDSLDLGPQHLQTENQVSKGESRGQKDERTEESRGQIEMNQGEVNKDNGDLLIKEQQEKQEYFDRSKWIWQADSGPSMKPGSQEKKLQLQEKYRAYRELDPEYKDPNGLEDEDDAPYRDYDPRKGDSKSIQSEQDFEIMVRDIHEKGYSPVQNDVWSLEVGKTIDNLPENGPVSKQQLQKVVNDYDANTCRLYGDSQSCQNKGWNKLYEGCKSDIQQQSGENVECWNLIQKVQRLNYELKVINVVTDIVQKTLKNIFKKGSATGKYHQEITDYRDTEVIEKTNQRDTKGGFSPFTDFHLDAHIGQDQFPMHFPYDVFGRLQSQAYEPYRRTSVVQELRDQQLKNIRNALKHQKNIRNDQIQYEDETSQLLPWTADIEDFEVLYEAEDQLKRIDKKNPKIEELVDQIMGDQNVREQIESVTEHVSLINVWSSNVGLHDRSIGYWDKPQKIKDLSERELKNRVPCAEVKEYNLQDIFLNNPQEFSPNPIKRGYFKDCMCQKKPLRSPEGHVMVFDSQFVLHKGMDGSRRSQTDSRQIPDVQTWSVESRQVYKFMHKDEQQRINLKRQFGSEDVLDEQKRMLQFFEEKGDVGPDGRELARYLRDLARSDQYQEGGLASLIQHIKSEYAQIEEDIPWDGDSSEDELLEW